MDATQTLINAVMLAAATTILLFTTRAQTRTLERRMDRQDARMDRLELKIDRLEERLELKIGGMGGRLDAKIEAVRMELDAKIEAVRTDITQLAFRLGERPHPQTG